MDTEYTVPEREKQKTDTSTHEPKAPEGSVTPPKKRRGRPPGKAIAKKQSGSRGAVGRPKGDAAIINEYKARMLASPQSRKVMQKIMDAALDDTHKHQAAAWKIVTDRIVPVSVFEQDIKKSGGKSGITINITGIGESVSIDGNDALDADYEEISDGE